MGCFYDRSIWHFSDRDECLKYFTMLVVDFDEKWPIRVEIFSNIPLEIVLDSSQQKEVEKKKANLHCVSFILHMSQA